MVALDSKIVTTMAGPVVSFVPEHLPAALSSKPLHRPCVQVHFQPLPQRSRPFDQPRTLHNTATAVHALAHSMSASKVILIALML